ncbi:hypothetical protein H2203_007326 [Taxawa tesnikishii (nom. ined.)]|nr:hypothetical protein H2203_007326 [Dothideales sp. JES 119]
MAGTGPVFFWRETEEPYGFLSQWYECAFEHEATTYASAEMWMMVQKARLFGGIVRLTERMTAVIDAPFENMQDTAAKMLDTKVPAEHQRLGRQVNNYDGKKWDANKSRIVEEGNWLKFTSSKESVPLRQKLLDTGDRELVETSPVDRIWGVGFDAQSAETNRKDWGENLLGKAIMRVRDRIRKEG